MQACSLLLGYYVINTYKTFGNSIPVLADDKYLTLINSIAAIFNSIRFVWSGALDKLSFKKVFGVLIIIQLVIAFTVKLAVLSRVSFCIMFCMTVFCIGGQCALFPNILKIIYGKQATFLFGILFTATGFGNLLIVGLVLSPAGDKYFVLYYLFGLLSIVALLILIFSFKQERFQADWPAVF